MLAYTFPAGVAAGGALTATTGVFSSTLSAVGITSTAGIAVGGALTGVTTAAFAGAVTGITSLAMSGALTGATTGAFSGTVTTGSLTATGNVSAVGGGVLSYPVSFSSPGGAAGDAVFQRGASTGAVYLGGATVAFRMDGGITTGGAMAFTRSDNGHFIPILAGPGASSGAAAGGYVPPVYNASGAALADTTHAVVGTFTGTGGSVTVTFTGASVFSGSSSYTVYVYNQSAGVVVNPSGVGGSSFSVAGTSNGNIYTYMAIGA